MTEIKQGDRVTNFRDLNRVGTVVTFERNRYQSINDTYHVVWSEGGPAIPHYRDQLVRVEDDYEWTAVVAGSVAFERERVYASISKVGGGTVGKAYEGLWEYRLTRNGEVIAEGSDLHTGTPKTHEQAARIAWEFYAPED